MDLQKQWSLDYFEYCPHQKAILADIYTISKTKVHQVYLTVYIDKRINGAIWRISKHSHWIIQGSTDTTDVSHCDRNWNGIICEGTYERI